MRPQNCHNRQLTCQMGSAIPSLTHPQRHAAWSGGKECDGMMLMGSYLEGVTLTLGSYAGCGVTRGFCCPGGGESSPRPCAGLESATPRACPGSFSLPCRRQKGDCSLQLLFSTRVALQPKHTSPGLTFSVIHTVSRRSHRPCTAIEVAVTVPDPCCLWLAQTPGIWAALVAPPLAEGPSLGSELRPALSTHLNTE